MQPDCRYQASALPQSVLKLSEKTFITSVILYAKGDKFDLKNN